MPMPVTLVRADAIADHRGVIAAPGAILLRDGHVVEAAAPQALGRVPDAKVVDVGGLVIPALVNAHAHLDLSGPGPAPRRSSFVEWVDEVVWPTRLGADDNDIARDVAIGVERSLAGGCGAIGDIAGSAAAQEAFLTSGMEGVSFLEVFGLGDRVADTTERIEEMLRGPRRGVQPHAPYSCAVGVYEAAVASGMPMSTHVAEMVEEFDAIGAGEGPIMGLLERLGVADAGVARWEAHPIDVLVAVLGGAPCLAAHCNYLEDAHLALLAASQVTVAYCPRASAYFGHSGHRWQEMVDAGVRVALGTDSQLCLDTEDRISVLDEMRLLHRRDGGDPATLLAMATVNGAAALGIDAGMVSLTPGPVLGLLAFEQCEDLSALCAGDVLPRWVHAPRAIETPAARS